jgi:hypothetical protein
MSSEKADRPVPADEPVRRRGDRRLQNAVVVEERRKGDRRDIPGVSALIRTLFRRGPESNS